MKEEEDIRLSVIIPMYQAEKHIRECVESVLYQKIAQIEILCVDDGSTDHTCDIVQNIMEKDSRVRLFPIRHGGVSKARNAGMDQANGRYLLFLDADDMLMPGKLPAVLRKAEQKKADILVYSGTTNTPFSTPLWIREAFSPSNKFYKTFSPDLFIRERGCRPSACNKLYRAQYLKAHNYRFPEELPIAEDHVFQFIVFPKARNITFSKQRLYMYRIHQTDSTMEHYTKQTQERIRHHQNAMQLIAEIWKQENYFTQDSYQNIYIITYLDLLFDHLMDLPLHKRSELAASMYQYLLNLGLDMARPSDRLQILQCYYENKTEEAEQRIQKGEEKSLIRKTGEKLSGPIRYCHKVGLPAAIEHYIGRLRRTEP